MKRLTQRAFKGGSLVAASLICFALAGCGGDDSSDGGGGVVLDPLVITEANMADVAGAVIITNSVGSSLIGGTDVVTAAQTSLLPPSPSQLLAQLAVKKLESAKDKLTGADVVSGTELPPIIEPCLNYDGNTGYISLTLDDRDNNGVVSVGDVITLTANNCQEYDGEILQTLTGTLRMTLTSSSETTLGLTAEYIDLKFDRPDFVITSDGTMQILETYVDANTTNLSVQSTSFSYKVVLSSGESYETHLTNLDFDATEILGTLDDHIEWTTVESMGAIYPTFTGSFDVTTLETVIEYYKNIDAGKLKVTGANNTTLYITFLGDNAVRLELDPDGGDYLPPYASTVNTTVQELNPIFDFD